MGSSAAPIMFGLEALKVGNEIRQAKAEDRFAQTQAKFNISMAQFKEREALRRGEINPASPGGLDDAPHRGNAHPVWSLRGSFD
jgi:hypothetical protein